MIKKLDNRIQTCYIAYITQTSTTNQGDNMTLLLFLSACLFSQPHPTVEIIYDEVEINGETPYNRG